MAQLEPGCGVHYAVRIARHLVMTQREIRALVEALEDPFSSVEILASSVSGFNPRLDVTTYSDGSIWPHSAAAASIFAVARAFDTLIAGGRAREEALGKIKQHSGIHLDPAVVGEFLRMIRDDDIERLVRRMQGSSGSHTETERLPARV